MCIALLAVAHHPRYPLIVLANRDEFVSRPTERMHVWREEPPIVAGRDLVGGGTWFGVSYQGRMALVTNYREPPEVTRDQPSRGELVTSYLRRQREPFQEYLEQHADTYAGFNIIFGEVGQTLIHYSNRSGRFQQLEPGLHGLSNALLNTPWPKVTRGLAKLDQVLDSHYVSSEEFFEILDDTQPAPLQNGLEQRLSSIRIPSESDYGSRSGTVLLVHTDGTATLMERSYEGGPEATFRIPARRR